MPRFKYILEYDGRPFYGWQTQTEKTGIQDYFEAALKKLFRQEIKVFCAGRTDRGVHAMGQVIHFDCDTDMTAAKSQEAMNYYVKPHPIAIIHAEIVPDDFHARFHATHRHYRYKILNRRAMPTYRKGLIWHVPKKIDLDKMHHACRDFIGTHDYTTFRSTQCQAKSPIRTIEKAFLEERDDEIHFCVHARSFLHHQIRSMIGSLVKIGTGDYPLDFIIEALLKKERSFCGPVAPPYGLYFEKVIY